MKRSEVDNAAVIMCGISGSGKTRYAKKLENRGYSRISTDALIWQKAGDKLFCLLKEEQQALFAECRKELRVQLIDCLRSGKKVVVDATHCRRSERDEIRKICGSYNVKPLFIYCQADEEELWRRLSGRKGDGPDDLIVTRTELSEYCRGFEKPQEDESDVIFLS